MKQFTLDVNNGPDIRFVGKLVAQVDNLDTHAKMNYWVEMSLYQTQGGKWIASRTKRHHNANRPEPCQAEVFEELNDITGFFGFGWMAKDLYEQAGLEFIVYVP